MDITLNFINDSDSPRAPDVLIFQKSVVCGFDDLAVAWKVIRQCEPGWSHPFVFSTALEIGISDDYGNHAPRLAASNGRAFELTPQICGRRLAPSRTGCKSNQIEVRNAMPRGAIKCNLYSSGSLLAAKSNVMPGDKATFSFFPLLWVGLAQNARQAMRIDPVILGADYTEFSMIGIASADMVMSGGGEGDSAAPYHFSLENVVRS